MDWNDTISTMHQTSWTTLTILAVNWDTLQHQEDKFSEKSAKLSNINEFNNMPVKKDNQKWNIIHIPASEIHLCDECGIKLGSK